MKNVIALILTFMFVGCFTSPSSSAIRGAKSMLTIGLNKSLARFETSPLIVVGGPSNQISSTLIDSTDKANPFQIVTIEWDTLKKQNYAFTYYLFNTDSGTIKLDSMTFSDSLMYTTKTIKGMNVTHSIGFNGDGIVDINYINDTQSIAGILHKRFVGQPYDSSVVVSIFGHDSLGVTKKLIVKIHNSMSKFTSIQIDTTKLIASFYNGGLTPLIMNYADSGHFYKQPTTGSGTMTFIFDTIQPNTSKSDTLVVPNGFVRRSDSGVDFTNDSRTALYYDWVGLKTIEYYANGNLDIMYPPVDYFRIK